jgi:hypothetical protein
MKRSASAFSFRSRVVASVWYCATIASTMQAALPGDDVAVQYVF